MLWQIRYTFNSGPEALQPGDQFTLPWARLGVFVNAHWQDGHTARHLFNLAGSAIPVSITDLRPINTAVARQQALDQLPHYSWCSRFGRSWLLPLGSPHLGNGSSSWLPCILGSGPPFLHCHGLPPIPIALANGITAGVALGILIVQRRRTPCRPNHLLLLMLATGFLIGASFASGENEFFHYSSVLSY